MIIHCLTWHKPTQSVLWRDICFDSGDSNDLTLGSKGIDEYAKSPSPRACQSCVSSKYVPKADDTDLEDSALVYMPLSHVSCISIS